MGDKVGTPPKDMPINVTGDPGQPEQLYQCSDCGAAVTYGSLMAIGGGPGHTRTCPRQHWPKKRENETDAATEIARLCRERDDALDRAEAAEAELARLREAEGAVSEFKSASRSVVVEKHGDWLIVGRAGPGESDTDVKRRYARKLYESKRKGVT